MKQTALKAALLIVSSLILFSCAKKEQSAFTEEEFKPIKTHAWYYFSESGFKQIDLPQNAPAAFAKPWTEAVRIACASSVVPPAHSERPLPFAAYALVNKKGILCLGENDIQLFCDESIFSADTADSLVFSGGKPVFYLYRSTFFNPNKDRQQTSLHQSRPFLVEFNAETNLFYPLVSYANLNLDINDQITGYFWNGSTWACSAKKNTENGVTFSYFYWQPLIPLAELSPALGQETFLFNPLTEEKYKELNMPKFFKSAPQELKDLLSCIPDEFSFYVSWKDGSGTTPVSYCQLGSSDSPFTARAGISYPPKYSAAVFADGTTYLKKLGEKDSIVAFRLPLLPSGFSYGEEAIAGNTLYVAWEESSFFKTARAGFISVNLNEILN